MSHPAGALDRGARVGVNAAWAVFAVAGLGAHLLLLTGALSGMPASARTLLAGFVVWVVPGYAFVRLGLVPPGGPWLEPGWALGFGVAWNAALVLLARLAGLPVTGLEQVTLIATAVLWVIALGVRRAADPAGRGHMNRGATVAVLLAAAAAALYVGRLGAVDTLQSDSPDHIGTIRRIMTSGDAFPSDAFFRDAGPAGVDPRKGVWHPQVAVAARLGEVDPHVAWRWLPTLLAPLFVLNVAALGLLAAGPAGAAIASWGLLLTLGGTIDQTPLREAVYSSRVANQLAFAATAAVLADLMRPARSLRLAAMGLGFGAITSHLFAVVHLAVPLGALGIALLVRDRRVGPDFRRLLGTSLAVAVAAMPFLFWRAMQAYAPVNVIHTEPQGLMYLTDHWFVMSPGFLWTTFSLTWILVPLLWVPLWRSGRQEPVALWILAATVAAALLTLNPLFVVALEPRVGYLIPRFLGFVPMAVMLAWAVPRAWQAAARGPRRAPGIAALVVIGATLVPACQDAIAVVPRLGAEPYVEWREGAGRWSEALDWMRAHLPPDAVVLSDPVTSYSIPMMTGRYVVTLVDQHSSPNDPHALDRLLDARDALDASSGWNRARDVIDRYGVDAIVLNDRFVEPPQLDYWGPSPQWFAVARSRFDAHPDAFPSLYDAGDFVIYGVNRPALDSLRSSPPPRPYLVPWRESAHGTGRRLDPRTPMLHGVRIARARLAPGDTLVATALWRAPEPLPAGSYMVAVRLDRPLPDGFQVPAFLGKPWRKLLEKLRGERYRLRSNHLPAGGAYSVDRWRPGQVVLDEFTTPIPPNAAPGEYVLQLRMIRQPHYPNFRLSDWFFDEDLFSGIPVATVTIAPREADHVRD